MIWYAILVLQNAYSICVSISQIPFWRFKDNF